MSIKRKDFFYRKNKETPLDYIEYENRKNNVRTYNIILRRSIFIANTFFITFNFKNTFLI